MKNNPYEHEEFITAFRVHSSPYEYIAYYESDKGNYFKSFYTETKFMTEQIDRHEYASALAHNVLDANPKTLMEIMFPEH